MFSYLQLLAFLNVEPCISIDAAVPLPTSPDSIDTGHSGQYTLLTSCCCYADELERGQHVAFSADSRTASISSRLSSSGLSLQNMPQHLRMKMLSQGIWPAALALFLSVSTSILVFPFFPYIPSSGRFGASLPQVYLSRPDQHASCCCCCCCRCCKPHADCASIWQHTVHLC